MQCVGLSVCVSPDFGCPAWCILLQYAYKRKKALWGFHYGLCVEHFVFVTFQHLLSIACMLCFSYVCNIKFPLLLISQVTVQGLCMYGWWTGVWTNHRTMLARSRFMLVLVVGALLAVLSFSLQYCKCETQCIISVTFPLWTYSYSCILKVSPGTAVYVCLVCQVGI